MFHRITAPTINKLADSAHVAPRREMTVVNWICAAPHGSLQLAAKIMMPKYCSYMAGIVLACNLWLCMCISPVW